MPSATTPLWRDVTILNELGLHARTAAKVAKAAHKAVGRIWLQAGGERVDAGEIIDILTLAAGKGDRVRIEAETQADQKVLEEITALFADGFGE